MTRAIMLVCLALACAVVAEARALKETRISPALKPESSKQFFNKDYPGDKRPKVDVLHFKHPYPVVQDSEDFDKDFVKDENTDNGEWKSQSEYDRLRHKLANLKKKAAEALAKKQEEKKELEAAMQKRDQDIAKDKADIAKKTYEIKEPVKPVKPVAPVKPVKPVVETTEKPTTTTPKPKPKEVKAKAEEVKVEEKKPEGWSWSWPWSWPAAETTRGPSKTTRAPSAATTTTAAPPTVDTQGAAEALEQSMKNLEDCQSELAAAKAELKKLMGELEKAKIKQVEAREKVNQAKIKQTEAEKHEDKLHKKFTAEAKDHADAEAAYLKQLAFYEKLHRELVAAAAKVKAMRNAEDKSGGVYPTKQDRSSASSMSLGLIFAAVAIAQVA